MSRALSCFRLLRSMLWFGLFVQIAVPDSLVPPFLYFLLVCFIPWPEMVFLGCIEIFIFYNVNVYTFCVRSQKVSGDNS